MRSLLALSALLSLSACVVVDDGPEGVIACSPEADVTYPDLGDGVDYVLEEGCDSWEIWDGSVTLEPGVTVEIPDGATVFIGFDGALIAAGTEELPVVLQGTNPDRPTWKGIQNDAPSSLTEFSHAVIDGAGDGAMIYFDDAASLVLWGDSDGAYQNLEIRNGGGIGLGIYGHADRNPGEFGPGLAFSGLEGASIVTEGHFVSGIDFDGYAATEVGSPGVEVYISNSNKDLEGEHDWSDIPVPLVFQSSVVAKSALSVGPGMELRFPENTGLSTADYGDTTGSLALNGTQDAPILLRGVLDVAGAWSGVCISTSTPSNHFENVEIRNGGDAPWTWEERGANLTLGYGKASLSAENVLIAGSADVGVLLDDDLGEVSFTPVNVTYADNAGGDLLDARD
ncbi:MAG: hypothetical protein VX899_22895 [Myxococcota bacterium]|nr:hypothetical protein [Myxococcota bacterium]